MRVDARTRPGAPAVRRLRVGATGWRFSTAIAIASAVGASCGGGGGGEIPYVTVVASATSALPATSTTPGAVASTTPRAQQLLGVCPSPLVIQLDSGMDLAATPYAALASDDGRSDGVRYQAAMVDPIDRSPTGIDIEIRTASALIAGTTAADSVLGDPTVLLATAEVLTVLPNDRLRPVAVAAPWARSDLALQWMLNSDVSGAQTIGDLAGTEISNPDFDLNAAGYLQATGLLPRKGEVGIVRPDAKDLGTTGVARLLHLLDDPTGATALVAGVGRTRGQLLAEVGWEPIPHALVVRPSSQEERTDCLRSVIPLVQRAVLHMDREPMAAVGHLAKVNARMGVTINADATLTALNAARVLGLLGVGSEAQPITADVTVGRIIQIAKAQATASKVVKPRIVAPSDVDQVASNLLDRRFLDSSYRFDGET